MKQLTNTEIQILSLMLPHALQSLDRVPCNYFSDTWFTRKQVTDLISKLDSMDDEIRKSRETGYIYEVVIQQDSFDSCNIVHRFDSLEEVDEFINKYKLTFYTVHWIPLKERYI